MGVEATKEVLLGLKMVTGEEMNTGFPIIHETDQLLTGKEYETPCRILKWRCYLYFFEAYYYFVRLVVVVAPTITRLGICVSQARYIESLPER